MSATPDRESSARSSISFGARPAGHGRDRRRCGARPDHCPETPRGCPSVAAARPIAPARPKDAGAGGVRSGTSGGIRSVARLALLFRPARREAATDWILLSLVFRRCRTIGHGTYRGDAQGAGGGPGRRRQSLRPAAGQRIRLQASPAGDRNGIVRHGDCEDAVGFVDAACYAKRRAMGTAPV